MSIGDDDRDLAVRALLWQEMRSELTIQVTEEKFYAVAMAGGLRTGNRLVLADDPEVIAPDVLANDQRKYEASGGDPRYVDRAHRRGKLGWNVGQKIAPSDKDREKPHARQPVRGRGKPTETQTATAEAAC